MNQTGVYLLWVSGRPHPVFLIVSDPVSDPRCCQLATFPGALPQP